MKIIEFDYVTKYILKIQLLFIEYSEYAWHYVWKFSV